VTVSFDPSRRTIVVSALLTGPTRTVTLDVLLDTGASDTFVGESKLVAAGYHPMTAPMQHSVLTGSGIVQVSEIEVMAFSTLGQVKTDFPVLSHFFPQGTIYDGVLGLDFLRGNVLTIDFIQGEITLAPGPSSGVTP